MKDKTLKKLVESIKASSQPKTSAYDTSATVTRVENGVAWVHIPGGVDETPVKLTINAQAGDTVQVRVSGGRAFMVGNATAPPTDNTVANKALGETKTITKVVKTVQKLAERTARIAGNTTQYFWHTQEGTDTGAHITEIPQEDFLADPTNGGGNLLARSNGVAVRDGLTELAQFASNGVALYDGASSSPMAQFRPNRAVIGKEGFSSVEISSDGIEAMGDDNNVYFSVKKTGSESSYIQKDLAACQMQTDAYAVNTVYGKTAHDEYPNIIIYLVLDEVSTDTRYVLVRDESFVWGTSKTKTVTATFNGDTYGFSITYDAAEDSILTEVTSAPSASNMLTVDVRWYVMTDAPAYKFGAIDKDLIMGEYAFAEGFETEATGKYSHASGSGCKATALTSEAHGLGTTASGSWQFVIGKLNDPDSNKAFIIGNGQGGVLSNALTVDWDGVIDSHTRSYEPTWASGQEPANSHCVVSAGLCSLFYQGTGGAHSNQTLLGTLPVGARPKSIVFCPCVKGANAYGLIQINTDGTINLSFISSASVTARLYFNCSYPVV